MFGAFRASPISHGGLTAFVKPWRMSSTRKANQRARMKQVDSVIAAVAESGIDALAVRKAVALPTESEMKPRDKYFTYNVHGRNFRKGVHHVPKFTRLTLRVNPKGF